MKNNRNQSAWPRIILHADMDAFFAAVEQLDDPSLKGKPVIIGGDSKRGVVSTASYEARKFGIGSAMPMAVAMRRCPDAVVIRPRMERYQACSNTVMEVFSNHSPLVEPLSLDEAFIDMTDAISLFGPPEHMASSVRRAVFEATGGLTVSVGASTTKYVAKVASDYRKPNGQTVISDPEVLRFLWPLSVKHLWGVGPTTQKRLENLGLKTLEQVARAGEQFLEENLGNLGPHIRNLANGIDPRPVIPHRDAKSLGAEYTLKEDVRGASEITPHLRRAVHRITVRLRRKKLLCRGIRVKLKTTDFRLLSRQASLRTPSDSTRDIEAAAVNLLNQFDLRDAMRLVGATVFDFVEEEKAGQLDLFADAGLEKRRTLDRTLDALVTRFGQDAIKRGGD